MKFITDMKDHPNLLALHSQSVEAKKRKLQQLEFIRKQADNLVKESEREAEAVWDAIVIELKRLNLIPQDYSKQGNQTLSFDDDNTQLFMREVPEINGIEDLLKMMRGFR